MKCKICNKPLPQIDNVWTRNGYDDAYCAYLDKELSDLEYQKLRAEYQEEIRK